MKLEKQCEQKPVDKVEPKFKVGDFIVKDYCMGKVIELTNDAYLLDTGQGIPFSCEHNVHLWTIDDAKDGDVLVCNINKAEIGGDIEKLPNITPTICVYQNVVKDKDYIHIYCSLYNGSSLVLSNSMYYNTFVYNIQPATKEQRDLLFEKMEEAGYEWDEEKKELKKIDKELEQDGFEAELNALLKKYEHLPKHELEDSLKFYLNVIREQKSKWTEEDDKILIDCYNVIHRSDYGKEMNLKIINWIKSLKERIIQ